METKTTLARPDWAAAWGPLALRVLLIAALAAGAFKYARATIWLQRGEVPGDLAVLYVAGVAARQGIGLYDAEAQRQLAVEIIGPRLAERYRTPLDSYTHPPSEVWLTVLISLLPWPLAGDLWRACLHIGFLGAVGWMLLDLRRQGASNERLWLAAVLAVWLTPAQTSVDFGQVDVPILLLMLLARECYRRGRPGWSGIVIGAAASLKPSPAVLLIFFLVRGDWRVIAGAVGAALAHVVASSAWLGPQVWFDWVFNVLPHLLGGNANYANQTFTGLGYHLFADATLIDSLAPPPALPAARALSLALNLAFLGAATLVARRYAARGKGLGFDLGYGLFILVMLVTSSHSWEHYYTWAYWPMAILLVPAAGVYRDRRDWPWAAAGLSAYALIIITPRFHVFAPEVIAGQWALRLLIPLKVYGAVLLAALVARALAQRVE